MQVLEGTAYTVIPRRKKSVEEHQVMLKGDRGFTVIDTWRSGQWYITPTNQDEVSYLQSALDDEDELEITCFEDAEFNYTEDGVCVELKFFGEWTEEEKKQAEDGYSEDPWTYLDDNGFSEDQYECYIFGGITMEKLYDE
jgi:hypothetical protein